MIIFDLDGTLADCEHRRHFVDPDKFIDKCRKDHEEKTGQFYNGPTKTSFFWIKDWRAYYDACDQDEPIEPIKSIFLAVHEGCEYEWEIWSGRRESVRNKTLKWLDDKIFSNSEGIQYIERRLKMRPIGDNTPEYMLIDMWVNQQCADMVSFQIEGKRFPEKHNIDFVFSSNVKTIEILRRRGIFVFDCNQYGKEF